MVVGEVVVTVLVIEVVVVVVTWLVIVVVIGSLGFNANARTPHGSELPLPISYVPPLIVPAEAIGAI